MGFPYFGPEVDCIGIINNIRPLSEQCFATLGLKQDCTVAEVKRAFREMVKTRHPDHGGSEEAFIELRNSYSQALAMVRGRG